MAIFPMIYFLKEDEQLLIESFTQRWVVNGPGQFTVPPFTRVKKRKGITLGPTQYVRINNKVTGEIRNEIGPKLVFLGASDEVARELNAITLQANQYVKLIDTTSGSIRVERGEQTIYLSPTEEILEDRRDGVNIDEHTAVLLRDITNGQLDLVTDAQVFIPQPTQEIIEARRRILLEDHEVVVIRDRTGRYIFKKGTDEDRAFFLDAYSELVKFRWASGIHKEKRELHIVRLDLRPKFMWYDFEVRTQDNVELMISITFFWQIMDVERMVRTTDDTTGDICAHARSAIIQAISRVTLERFLAEFNTIVAQAVLINDPFYDERGVQIRAVEVRAVNCKEPETQRILQDIIRETTNRLNRLQKQDSENEIKLRSIQGDIEAEQTRGQLLEIQRQHARTEGLTTGEAEAERILAFINGLGDSLSAADKIAVFNTLRKREVLEKLSEGSANLYFTPSDVELSIK
jgi:regulator of protease activity HflC (stomatin/prohibitin superfamily)